MGKTTALSTTRNYNGYFGFSLNNNSISLCKGMIRKVDEEQLNKTVVLEDVFNIEPAGIVTGTDPYSYGELTWTYPQKPHLRVTVNPGTINAGDAFTFNGRVYTAVVGAKSDNTEFSIDSGVAITIENDLGDSWNNDTRPQEFGNFVYDTFVYTQQDLNFIGSSMPTTILTVTGTSLSTDGGNSGLFEKSFDGDTYVESQLIFLGEGIKSAFTESRPLQIELSCTVADGTTPGIMKTVLKKIADMEKLVARNGDPAYLDGIYENVVMKDGTNPFAPTQNWYFEKDGDYYFTEIQI